ncbi:PilZ domain-containing protein [Kineosporia sp. J2-2]|uniref:PilZ domain-containing protein n=1 Tax=Kineosporia corallincola TaxID=2835133 RepID=A0ABS5TMY8_9ACTN|nr:PilZ domain-containing protein [Kineosporia corallincola]MBT0772457.1 PilZ domain-containing protein [Kineosporia corallincola]
MVAVTRSVARGSKLVVRAGDVTVPMRSLRSVDISGTGWAIPVMADLDSLARLPDSDCVLDLTTDGGPVRVDVEVVAADGDLVLRSPRARPSGPIHPASLTDQRRENVRGPLRLGFRGTAMAMAATSGHGRRQPRRRTLQPGLLAARGPGADAHADLVGGTTSISAGGVQVELEDPAELAAGATVYGEITLPDGDLVPALMLVVEQTRNGFRAEFTDISPLDTERLVRLVFNRERSGLAGRRR